MRKTLKRNLAYDDEKDLFYVSFYCEEGGRRVRRAKTYPTLAQAEEAMAQRRMAQLVRGGAAPADMTLEEWLRYWMEELILPNCEKTTVHGYENIVYVHLIPALGEVRVQELTPMRVQQYYGELRKKGLANNTIRKHHQRGKISDELRHEALYLAESYRDKALMDNDYAADGYARDMELEHIYAEAEKRLK